MNIEDKKYNKKQITEEKIRESLYVHAHIVGMTLETTTKFILAFIESEFSDNYINIEEPEVRSIIRHAMLSVNKSSTHYCENFDNILNNAVDNVMKLAR